MNPQAQDWWNPGNNARDWWNEGSGGAGSAMARTPRNTYNAKNLPLGDSALAADNYIGDDDPLKYFQKIYADRGTEDGGSKQIYEKLVQRTSPEFLKKQGQNPNSLQWSLARDAVQTGKVDPRLRPDLMRTLLGTGLSETARHQQHKPKNFFTQYLMDPLVMAGLSLVPGVGPALAVGYGGIKGGVEDGPLGAFTGALGGYGASGFTNWLKNGMTAGFGALNNANAFMPADIAARAGTSTLQGSLPFAGAVKNVGRGVKLAGALRGRNRPQPGPRP